MPAGRRVILRCMVVLGKPFEAHKDMKNLKTPPEKCDSVWGNPGESPNVLNFEEFVTYLNFAILPEYVFFYPKP
jgi:hypothetical protein